ncbi:MAG: hypothetical protein IPP37_12645 [Saprospiraceae bacterium]|nr:hypothetical protein [Saprospiraceae bacterium]
MQQPNISGRGDTRVDSHKDLPVMATIQPAHEVELYPFKKLIDAGVAGIMTPTWMCPYWQNKKA